MSGGARAQLTMKQGRAGECVRAQRPQQRRTFLPRARKGERAGGRGEGGGEVLCARTRMHAQCALPPPPTPPQPRRRKSHRQRNPADDDLSHLQPFTLPSFSFPDAPIPPRHPIRREGKNLKLEKKTKKKTVANVSSGVKPGRGQRVQTGSNGFKRYKSGRLAGEKSTGRVRPSIRLSYPALQCAATPPPSHTPTARFSPTASVQLAMSAKMRLANDFRPKRPLPSLSDPALPLRPPSSLCPPHIHVRPSLHPHAPTPPHPFLSSR